MRCGARIQIAGVDCWAAFAYDGPAGAMVRALKFRSRTALADSMAAHLIAELPADLRLAPVVPVPVHRAHRKRRGIDHAHALAAAFAERGRLDLRPCLERTGNPRPQVGRGMRERVLGPSGPIALLEGAAVPAEALLIDDVTTTGATLAACAQALRAAGCRQISAISYARTTAR
jgi:predicted amidophosphoribosyltransferase